LVLVRTAVRGLTRVFVIADLIGFQASIIAPVAPSQCRLTARRGVPARRNPLSYVALTTVLVRKSARQIIAGFAMHIIGVIIIGFVAGIIARFLAPGSNNPAGFILTTLLGIAGAFVATLIGQAIGWYQPDKGAGLLGAVVGALVVLFIWHRLVSSRAIPDPGARRWL
jgi:uncharacterized membrane protein YeaQ/YmgE (transglycosylase-associated protein family)